MFWIQIFQRLKQINNKKLFLFSLQYLTIEKTNNLEHFQFKQKAIYEMKWKT